MRNGKKIFRGNIVQYFKWRRELPLHLFMLPGMAAVVIFCYIPMAGVIMAFQKYEPTLGILSSKWTGLANFNFIFNIPDIFQVIWNTVFIALMKIVAGLVVPVLIALLLNELNGEFFKRTVQTMIYLPHFLSWIILGGILIDILSPSRGIVNEFLGILRIQSIFFLGDPKWFPHVLVITNIWKEAGFGTIIYLAALTSIDMTLYEASTVDGANRFRQVWHITLPGIMPIIVLMTVLSLGNILNAGFDQVFNLYSPAVYKTGDILDTMVYRLGLVDFQFGPATAVGLLKSVVSLLFISVSYKLAGKYANYKVF